MILSIARRISFGIQRNSVLIDPRVAERPRKLAAHASEAELHAVSPSAAVSTESARRKRVDPVYRSDASKSSDQRVIIFVILCDEEGRTREFVFLILGISVVFSPRSNIVFIVLIGQVTVACEASG